MSRASVPEIPFSYFKSAGRLVGWFFTYIYKMPHCFCAGLHSPPHYRGSVLLCELTQQVTTPPPLPPRSPVVTPLLGGRRVQAVAWVPPQGLVIVANSDIYYQVLHNPLIMCI